jgi:hypothetical protein
MYLENTGVFRDELHENIIHVLYSKLIMNECTKRIQIFPIHNP